jgi:hypothetical protein
MEPKRMKARIAEEDLRFTPGAAPVDSRETWQAVIDAGWDMTIASVACNDLRHPLARVPASLDALEKTVRGVRDPATLAAIEEEVKAGIRVFSEMAEGVEVSKERMERVLRAAWHRRTELRVKGDGR